MSEEVAGLNDTVFGLQIMSEEVEGLKHTVFEL